MQQFDRIIPTTMGTQHPDHAGIPYWYHEAFIPAAKEVTECFLSFSELGMTEYMWDWEGKMVDEAVLDRLFIEYSEYFQQHPIGKEKFLTFRLPNPKVEMEYRLGRAFTGMMSASALARHMQYAHHPLFEVILPMTETAEEMISVQEAFRELASLTHPLLKFGETSFTHIELIPLFETITEIASVDTILSTYVDLHMKRFGFKPTYIRPFLARSDPALNAGLLPTVLSIKIALSRLDHFEKKTGIPVFPILGAAALPFRGGLTPYTVNEFMDEYAGIRTTTIQSGFKYDFPKEDVIRGIAQLNDGLVTGTAQHITPRDEEILRSSMNTGEMLYKRAVETIAPVINTIAGYLPRRRERVQHVGLFGYSRGVGTVKLPRAIGFTAALYSLGIPPELIATGRTLFEAKNNGSLPVIEKYYRNLASDIRNTARYVNLEVVEHLAKEVSGFASILDDIHALEEYAGYDFGPVSDEEKEYTSITSSIYTQLQKGTLSSEYIERAALLRKSLG